MTAATVALDPVTITVDDLADLDTMTLAALFDAADPTTTHGDRLQAAITREIGEGLYHEYLELWEQVPGVSLTEYFQASGRLMAAWEAWEAAGAKEETMPSGDLVDYVTR